jgi:hypothetical protein
MTDSAPSFKARQYLACARGVQSAVDLTGLHILRDGLFRPPAWTRTDPAGAIAQDMGRVMARFGMSAKCGREALANGQDINRLPLGCTDGAVPRRLPLRHVTATHSTIRR